MDEQIQDQLRRFQDRLSEIRRQRSSTGEMTKLSRTQKRIVKNGGAAVGKWLTGESWGKQIGRALAGDLVDDTQKAAGRKAEQDCLHAVDSLLAEIKTFLWNVSFYNSRRLESNSSDIIQRFEKVKSNPTCKGKIGTISRILNSLQTRKLVSNKTLLALRQKKEKEERSRKEPLRTRPSRRNPTAMSLRVLIQNGENRQGEFKSSLRWDTKRNCVNKSLEYVVVKTIAGFMNASGGVLLIGVADDGHIRGLERDLKSLTKKDKDGFELQLRQIVESFGAPLHEKLISIDFETVDDKEVCRVNVEAASNPVFIKSQQGQKQFPARFGNRTKILDVQDANTYIRRHFKDFSGP